MSCYLLVYHSPHLGVELSGSEVCAVWCNYFDVNAIARNVG